MAVAQKCEEFAWGRMEWLADGADKGVSLARMSVRPGMISPAHRHANCNEVIHVLSGAPMQRCGAVWRTMAPGETITLYAGETHQTRNDADIEATMMIAYSSGARAYEEVAE